MPTSSPGEAGAADADSRGPLEWSLAEFQVGTTATSGGQVDAQRVAQTLFGPDAAEGFWLPRYAEEKMKDVAFHGWDTGAFRVAQQCVEYTVPRKGLQPKTKVFETQRVLHDGSDGSGRAVIEVVATTPGVPFGKTFESVVRYVLTQSAAPPAAPAAPARARAARAAGNPTSVPDSVHWAAQHWKSQLRRRSDPTPTTVTVTVTGQVNWLKTCSMKSIISKKVLAGMTKSTAATAAQLQAVMMLRATDAESG